MSCFFNVYNVVGPDLLIYMSYLLSDTWQCQLTSRLLDGTFMLHVYDSSSAFAVVIFYLLLTHIPTSFFTEDFSSRLRKLREWISILGREGEALTCICVQTTHLPETRFSVPWIYWSRKIISISTVLDTWNGVWSILGNKLMLVHGKISSDSGKHSIRNYCRKIDDT